MDAFVSRLVCSRADLTSKLLLLVLVQEYAIAQVAFDPRELMCDPDFMSEESVYPGAQHRPPEPSHYMIVVNANEPLHAPHNTLRRSFANAEAYQTRMQP